MIYLNSDTVFLWDGLMNSITEEYINTATVSGKVLNLDEEQLATFTLNYTSASNGDYLGTLLANQLGSLVDGDEVIVEITAISGSATDCRRERHTCGYRGYE